MAASTPHKNVVVRRSRAGSDSLSLDMRKSYVPVNFWPSTRTSLQWMTSSLTSSLNPFSLPRNGPRVPGSSGPNIF